MSSQEHLVENDTLDKSDTENEIAGEAEEKETRPPFDDKTTNEGDKPVDRKDVSETNLSSSDIPLNRDDEPADGAEESESNLSLKDKVSHKDEVSDEGIESTEARSSTDENSKNEESKIEVSFANATIEMSIDDPTDSNAARTEKENEIIANKSKDSSIIMQSDVTDFIEFKKDISTENNGAMKCVTSFRLEFDDVAGFSTISQSKAWIHNHHKLKLVDIERGEVLRSYYSEAPFNFVNGLNESIVFLSFHYEIDRLSVNEDGTNTLATLLNFSSGIEQSSQCRLNAFSVSKSGDFIVCLTRRTGCLCFTKEISFIERFDSRATFMKRSKIEHKGHYLIREAYDVVESNNGDICIAGEKYQERGEYWVIVLDSKFQFRFSYDRNTSSQIHVPASMATDLRNNVLIVNKFRDRTKPKKTPLTTTKKKKELTYVAIIDEDGIFREHLPTEGFHNDGTVCNVSVDSDGKIWMILDSGQIIVATFDYLSKCPDDQTITKM